MKELKPHDQHLADLYQKHANNYDNKRYSRSKDQTLVEMTNHIILRDILAFTTNQSTEQLTILDLASGTGQMPLFFKQHNIGQPIAFDISANMMKMISQKPGGEDVPLVLGNVRILPFASNSVDVITMANFLHLISLDHYPTYVADAYRVLRPGGVLVVNMNNWFCIANPINFLKVAREQLLHRANKSYIHYASIRKAFTPFQLKCITGINYPYSYRLGVEHLNTLIKIGRTPLLRVIGGRFVVTLAK